MKILVLGGTGAMGVHLVSLLAEQGNQVVVTSRTRTGDDGNIKYLTGNAKDENFFESLLSQHWDVVVDFMIYTTEIFQHRFKQLLEATGHYIYLSSSRVYADSEQPITEDSPRLLDITKDQIYLATDEYALTKARQENLLFESKKQNWTIVRPYITYSEDRLQLGVLEKEDWLYRALRGKAIIASRDIQSKFTTMTFGKDVAKGIAAIIGHQDAKGEAFHITSDITIGWSEVLDIYMSVLENHLSEKPSVIMQNLIGFMKWRRGKYQIIYDRLYDRQFDNAKIKKFINTSSFIQPQTGLADCLDRFINYGEPQFNLINWKAEAIKDRMVAEYTPLKEITGLKQKVKYFVFRNLPLA